MTRVVDRATYQALLNAHGRRVANRAVVETMGRDELELSKFYDCYGSEDVLPPNECARTEMIREYDPAGYSRLYDDHPWDERSLIYITTNGLSATLFDQIVGAVGCWGEWIIGFLSDVFHELPNETADSIVDDEGEHYAEDGCRFCNWFPGWRGWRAWGESLSADEERAWKLMLAPRAHTFRHPEPGSPEAEARYPTEKREVRE